MSRLRAACMVFSLVLASLALVGGLTLWRLRLPTAAAARVPAVSVAESARAGHPDSGSALLELSGAELLRTGNSAGVGEGSTRLSGESSSSSYTRTIPASGSLRSLLNGTRSSVFQAAFEKTLPIRDFAIELWGRLRWDFFRQGYSGLLVGRDGWLFSTEEFQADLGYLQHDLTELLADTSVALHDQGIQLLVVPVPPKALVHQRELRPYRPDPAQERRHAAFLKLLQELDIPTVDLLAVYTAEGPGPRQEYFMRSDTHWSPFGAELAARAIAERVGSLPCAATIAHSSFSEEASEPLSVTGDLLSFLPERGGWFRPLPPAAEISPLRLKAEAGSSAGSLFGAQTIPVALVGTSYSASALWGFENSLKLALAADVLPLAREGLGPFRPMQDALEAGYLAENKVRLVIWEIPERYIPFAALP